MSKLPIWPSAMCCYDNKIWFFHGILNAFFEYSFEEDNLTYLGSIPNSIMVGKYPYYCSVIPNGDNIYMVPFYGDSVTKYDCKNNTIEKITGTIINDYSIEKYSAGFIIEDFLYCVPYNPNLDLIRINLQNDEKDIFPIFRQAVNEHNAKYIDKVVIKDNKIIGIVGGTSKLFSYDIKNNKVNIIQIPVLKNKNVDSCSLVSDDLFVHLEDEDEILKINIDNNNLKIIDKYKITNRHSLLVSGTGNYIFLDSTNNASHEIIKNGKSKYIEENNKKNISFLDSQTFVGTASSMENYSFYFDRYNNEILELNSKKIKKPYIKTNDEETIKMKIVSDKNVVLIESNGFSLGDFIKYL